MPFRIHNLILGLLALFAFALVAPSAGAQTLNVTPNTVEVISAGAATRDFYPLGELMFVYKSSTHAFEVQVKHTKSKLWGGHLDSVTVTGATTRADKLEKLRYKCFEANTTIGYRVFVSRPFTKFKYTNSSKRLELMDARNGQPLWFGHIDSLKVTGLTTSAQRLTHVRSTQGRPTFEELVSLGDSATIAAGAAAGTSPTVSVSGNALSGTVTITSGTSPTTTGVIATITLPVSAPNGYRITGITAKDATGAAQYGRIFWTTTGSTLVANASGTAISGTLTFDYGLVAY